MNNHIRHIGDFKTLHLDKKWNRKSLTTCGKVLECLRMTIDYTVRDMAKISMYKYIVKLLTKLPSDMNRVPKMPAPRHLVNVNAEDLEFCLKLKL